MIHLLEAFGQGRERRALIRQLSGLNDHMLRDIGIERSDIRAVAEGMTRPLVHAASKSRKEGMTRAVNIKNCLSRSVG